MWNISEIYETISMSDSSCLLSAGVLNTLVTTRVCHLSVCEQTTSEYFKVNFK